MGGTFLCLGSDIPTYEKYEKCKNIQTTMKTHQKHTNIQTYVSIPKHMKNTTGIRKIPYAFDKHALVIPWTQDVVPCLAAGSAVGSCCGETAIVFIRPVPRKGNSTDRQSRSEFVVCFLHLFVLFAVSVLVGISL